MKNIANWFSFGCLGLFLLIPTLFSLTWLVHLFVTIPFINDFWDIALGSMIVGSLGVSMISTSKSKIEKTDEDKKQINFYSGLITCLVSFNAGIFILSGILTGLFSSFDDITYGIYAKYLLMGISSLLIATAILTAGLHIKRYYK